MSYPEAILQLFHLALCLILTGLWQRERGRALGWQEHLFETIKADENRRDHFGRFRKKDAPTHTWRTVK
jgi:hypothetical protein